MGKFKLKINSNEKLESLLQEIYDDSIRTINLIQNKISELEESTNLSDQSIEMKVKYAKAIHDYITDRDKALGRKLDITRLLTEILKNKGDIGKVLSDEDVLNNLSDEFQKIKEEVFDDSNSANEPAGEYYNLVRSIK